MPIGQSFSAFTPANIGTAAMKQFLDAREFITIYVLNKLVAPKPECAKEYAMLRLCAIANGFSPAADNKEVTSVVAPTDAAIMDVYTADSVWISDNWALYMRAGLILPYASEHIFRTMGHHYLSGDAALYNNKYTQFLTACLVPEIMPIANSETRYYDALSEHLSNSW